MEEHPLDLERLVEEDELFEEYLDLEENSHEQMYGLEPQDQYLCDVAMFEVEEAIEDVVDTPDEKEEVIMTLGGLDVIRIHDECPEIIEEPKRKRWNHGPRYS